MIKNKNGVSLIEILVSIMIISIIFYGVYSLQIANNNKNNYIDVITQNTYFNNFVVDLLDKLDIDFDISVGDELYIDINGDNYNISTTNNSINNDIGYSFPISYNISHKITLYDIFYVDNIEFMIYKIQTNIKDDEKIFYITK